jgi:hypothetical protein
MRRLEVGLLPRLTSLEPLATSRGLEYLRLSKCGRASNYDALGHLQMLRGLLIDTDKDTQSLHFTEPLSKLRIFNFALNVRDGDIKRLLSCGVLAKVHFADRKNYNISREELNQILRCTRAPLTNEEEYCFRFIGHGISDWSTSSGEQKTLVARE